MKKLFKSLVCTAALVLFTASAFANDYVKFNGWKQAETTHFRFIYEAASEEAAKKYAEFADEAWEKIARIYSMPQEKTNVYVFSRLNVVNAYTYFTPPEIVMFDSPILESTFGFRDDWMELFFTHELIHIANITFEDKKYLTSKLFGEAFRGMDYSMIPGWALEGLTTVLETELTDGGRGRSPYFELNFKAPTMDNNLIPYRLIGTEQEPPYGQIYVMGYLIMRTIADKWGLQALADIERNRNMERSWEESVKLVTGQTPQDIYRETKIALEKRYANERQIPEGKIISPNDTNEHYYRPAIVFDDGTLITIRSTANSKSMAVLLNPGAKDGLKYYDIEKEKNKDDSDSKKQVKETVLFTANFCDLDSITADQDKTVYYTSAVSRYDRNPGNETQFPIYKWTPEGSSVRLTNDESSYYQPAVSRDGTLLIAVEQNGLKMRIVKIDTQTGDKTVLFDDPRYSFIQPALNQDGSQIAFLLLKEDRACVAIGDTATGQYKIVNNTDYDFITDPSRPNFNEDGTLTFCSNDRGRLEIFEATPNSDGQTFTCTPVVADPIGALWAYKNDFGIFYTSMASTGSVIKIKPVEEWGNVPDFEGPSPAGEIMTFAELHDDYPDFNPYEKIAENKDEENDEKNTDDDEETTDKETSDESDDTEDTDDTDNSDHPKDKIKHRSPEKIVKLDDLEPGVTELSNEKIYFPKISSLFYSPFINVVSDNDTSYLGIGGVYAGMFPKLQMVSGLLWMDAFYYPKLKNFTGEIIGEIPVSTGTIDFFIARTDSFAKFTNNDSGFVMSNMAFLGYTQRLISRDEINNSKSLNLITYAGFTMNQQDQKAFELTADLPFTKQLSFHAGLDYSQYLSKKPDENINFSFVNLALANFDFNQNKLKVGFEGEYSVKTGSNSFTQETSLVVRYTDFASETIPSMSRAHLNGQQENCLFPGKLVLNYSYIIPDVLSGFADMSFNVQGMASFGKNSDGKTPDTEKPLNFQLDKKFTLGLELSMPLGLGQKIALGYSGLFEVKDGKVGSPDAKFYLTCKFNWLRF